jgi:hypothetical protein
MNVHDEIASLSASRRRTLPTPVIAAATAAAFALLAAAPSFGQFNDQRPQEDVTGRIGDPLSDDPLNEADTDDDLMIDLDGDGIIDVVEDDDDISTAPAYSVGAGVTVTSAYYFRGINQGVANEDGLFNGGFIAQPYIELGIPIVADPSKGYGLSAIAGTWNSFGSEQTNDDDAGPTNWYESDLYAGLGFTTGNFEIGAIYTFYTSPNDSFATVQEIGGFIGYGIDFGDDPDIDNQFTGGIDLAAGVYFEVDNTAVGFDGIADDPATAFDETVDGITDEGIYLELGVEPSLDLEIDGLAGDVALSFPIAVGLSLADYYYDDSGDDEFFGYVSVAAAASIPLPVPANYGAWSLTPSVQGLFLGANNLEALNDDESTEFIGSLSLDFEF